jgi:hypothetical protein
MAKRSCPRGWPDVLVICRKPSGYAFLKYRKAFYIFIIEFDLAAGVIRVGSGGWFDRCRGCPPSATICIAPFVPQHPPQPMPPG